MSLDHFSLQIVTIYNGLLRDRFIRREQGDRDSIQGYLPSLNIWPRKSAIAARAIAPEME